MATRPVQTAGAGPATSGGDAPSDGPADGAARDAARDATRGGSGPATRSVAESLAPERFRTGRVRAGRSLERPGQYFSTLPLQGRVFLSQLPLTGSVLLVLIFVLLVPQPTAPVTELAATPSFFLGVAGIMVLTVVAGVVPWDRFPPVYHWAIPLLDFVAIAAIWGSARHVLDGMTILSAFPVVWLAWSGMYPVWGLTLGFIGTSTVTSWPYLIRWDTLPEQALLRPALVPLFMLTLGVAVSVLARSLARQRSELQDVVASMQQQNRRLETILETTNVGIVVTDRDGTVLIRNAMQRRQRLICQPKGREDATERELLVFDSDGVTPVPEDDRPIYRAVREENFTARLYALGTDGSQQFVSVSAQAMRDEDGRFDGSVVVFHNVTDLIDAIQAQEKFVADVSHEFRTPLTSIIGFLDLAIEDEQDTKVARYLKTSQRNAERLLTMVNALLDAASSRGVLAVQETDLALLVRHSVESAQVRATNGKLTLVSRVPDTLVARVDKIKMSQVADNLVSNAIKYTEPGGTVTVTVRRAGECAEIEVADTGIGMSASEQEKLFSNFYRTEHVRRAAIPGTGLGLAISRSFVSAHGGEISVASEKGVGTVFTVLIPLTGPLVDEADAQDEDVDYVHAPS